LSSGGELFYGVAIQQDGMIVAAGTSYGSGGFAVARYSTIGILDPTFGNGGVITTLIHGEYASAQDVVLQPDGRILAVGSSDTPDCFALARYVTNGEPDLSFGTGGVVTTAIGNSSEAYGVALQPNGRIVVAGHTSGGPTFNDFAVARYMVSGTLDTSFGASGVVTTEFGNSSQDYAF
jgi:uncharacterized delta-60 repeat protein